MAFGVVSRVSLALSLLALALVGIYIYKNTDVTVVQDFDKVIMESSSSLLEQITARYLSQELCILLAVKSVVREAINAERRMGASLIRLFFHDCFVDGCDGGVLLNDIPGIFQGEKTSPPNNNSARGYFVIDQAKQRIRERCPRAAVSCADILAIAARDSVVLLGGLSYPVRLGRRDARTANFQAPLDQLPAPFDDVNTQVRKFVAKGMTIKEMVVLAGAHTIGFAKCTTLCDNRNVNPAMQSTLKCNCPVNNDNTNLVQLDSTPGIIDKVYFDNLNRNQGLLFSDQVLMGNQTTADFVRFYSSRLLSLPFKIDFAAAMAKLGNLPPRPGVQLEIRNVCSRVN